MVERSLSDAEEMAGEGRTHVSRRMSLPVVGRKDSVSNASGNSAAAVLLAANRRHTLMPLRSILKSSAHDQGPGSSRRVSFAGQVSVHKFQIASSPRKRQRVSSPLVPTKLSIHEFMMRRGSVNVSLDSVDQTGTESSFGNEDSKQNRLDEEIAQLHASKYQNYDEIHEDNSTQTMEMSVELTNQIKEQQKAVMEQAEVDLSDNMEQNEETDSFRELFDDLDAQDGDDADADVSMEITQPVEPMQILHSGEPVPILESPELERAILEMNDASTMELTKPIEPSEVETRESFAEASDNEMEITQAINKYPKTVGDDQTVPMDITTKLTPVVSQLEIDDQTQTMNLTQKVGEPIARPETPCEVDESAMELTVPIKHIPFEDQAPSETDTETTFQPAPLSTVAELSEPGSAQSPAENIATVTASASAITNNTREAVDPNVSTAETYDVTEMVPLADVSESSIIQSDNFESADILEDDDNYINVTLATFLKDINVQFFETIGPSDREIQDTLTAITAESSAADFSPSSSNASSSSTPSKSLIQGSEERRQTLLDYIDAANNILYYHYLTHIISQYRASIKTISSMVHKFSSDVEDSNLQAMKEYYSQSIDLQADLRTNYQAIASFTRKQAQNENMQFICGLLGQLIASYDKDKAKLGLDYESAVEWRKDVLLQRQRMIEKKMELSTEVERLQKIKHEWSLLDIPRWKEANEKIKEKAKVNSVLEKEIKELEEKQRTEEQKLHQLDKEKAQVTQEVVMLTDQLESMKMPIDVELNELTKQLREIEEKTGISIVSENPLELLINDDLSIVFKEDTTIDVHILRLHHFKPFQELAELFSRKFVHTHKEKEPFVMAKLLRNEWLKFKRLWNDLATIYYIYPTAIDGTGFTVEFKFGKVRMNCTFEDLLDETKPISVELREGNVRDAKAKLETCGALQKRLDYI